MIDRTSSDDMVSLAWPPCLGRRRRVRHLQARASGGLPGSWRRRGAAGHRLLAGDSSVAPFVSVPAASAHANEPLGHTRARTRTGASIVAIVRGEDVIASPMSEEVLRAGDVLVVIGTHDGINSVRRIIEA